MRSILIAGVLVELATAVMTPSPVFASDGCRAFHGGVNSKTKGEGGSRVGHGFNKADTLSVSIHQSPTQMKVTVNLLE